MQTLVLARETYGRITAVDRHQPYLDELDRRAKRQWLSDRIHTINASMMALDLPDETFDLIWSEGAIYVMGFEQGLRAWKRLLKPGGAIAVTEVSWLGPPIPDDVRRFWTAAYPAMTDTAGNLRTIEMAGYAPLGHFALPESAWWDDYYTPIETRIAELKDKYRDDQAALEFLRRALEEIDLQRRGAGSYGYVFYMARKTESAAPR